MSLPRKPPGRPKAESPNELRLSTHLRTQYGPDGRPAARSWKVLHGRATPDTVEDVAKKSAQRKFERGVWHMPPAEDMPAILAARERARKDPMSLKGARIAVWFVKYDRCVWRGAPTRLQGRYQGRVPRWPAAPAWKPSTAWSALAV